MNEQFQVMKLEVIDAVMSDYRALNMRVKERGL